MIDGSVDYGKYSLQQLREAESAIDRLKYPANCRRLEEEIIRRGQIPSPVRLVTNQAEPTTGLSLAGTWRQLVRDTLIVVAAQSLGGAIVGFITGGPTINAKQFWVGAMISGLIFGVASYAAVGLMALRGRWTQIRRVAVAHLTIALVFRAVVRDPVLGNVADASLTFGEVITVVLNVCVIAVLGGLIATGIAKFKSRASKDSGAVAT